jgi:GNAT superfamily N-acetyltransferase
MVDRFFSLRLGVSVADLKPGQVAVATCDRRTFAERGYGFVRLLWIVHLGDRAAVSVHPAALVEVSRLAWGIAADAVLADDFVERAARAVTAALPGVATRAGGIGVTLYHPGAVACLPTDGAIRPLAPTDAQKWIGERVYASAATHPSAQHGEAFGLFLADRLVAEVITHEDAVADMGYLIAQDGIEVADAYRGRGYGRALLAAWTSEMQARGRACIHSTAADNAASVALAHSVGYVEYARARGVTAKGDGHAVDEEPSTHARAGSPTTRPKKPRERHASE